MEEGAFEGAMRRTFLVLAFAVVAACGVKAPPRPPTSGAASAAPASSGTTPSDVPPAPKDTAPIPSSNASPGSTPR